MKAVTLKCHICLNEVIVDTKASKRPSCHLSSGHGKEALASHLKLAEPQGTFGIDLSPTLDRTGRIAEIEYLGARRRLCQAPCSPITKLWVNFAEGALRQFTRPLVAERAIMNQGFWQRWPGRVFSENAEADLIDRVTLGKKCLVIATVICVSLPWAEEPDRWGGMIDSASDIASIAALLRHENLPSLHL